jgi:hypothetical protein
VWRFTDFRYFNLTIDNKGMKNLLTTEEFCLYYQEMREAQNAYFASKKGQRFPSKESKMLLGISKKLEADLDLKVKECLGKEVNNG